MAVSSNIETSIRVLDPKPQSWRYKIASRFHGSYLVMIITQVVLMCTLYWTLTSQPVAREFYYSMVIQVMLGMSIVYEFFWLRNRKSLMDVHIHLLKLVKKLEETATEKEREIIENTSKKIARITAIVVIAFYGEAVAVAAQPLSDSRLPSSLRGLPMTDTGVMAAMFLQAFIFLPLVTCASHYLLCQTRMTFFLVLCFNLLVDRIRETRSDEDLREIASMHSEVQAVSRDAQNVFEPYNCVAITQYFLMVMLSTVATLQNVNAPEVTALIPMISGFILIFCVLGDMLQKASAQMFLAAYSCKWYERKIPFQKTLLIILSRSIRPSNIRAALYGNMSMPLSLNLLKMWYRFVQALINIT